VKKNSKRFHSKLRNLYPDAGSILTFDAGYSFFTPLFFLSFALKFDFVSSNLFENPAESYKSDFIWFMISRTLSTLDMSFSDAFE